MVKHQPKDIEKFIREIFNKNLDIQNRLAADQSKTREFSERIVQDYGLIVSADEVEKILKKVLDEYMEFVESKSR